MSPLFMDTGYNSPVTVSDEGSNSAGLEREEGQQMGGKGRKRQEKNRDAARKSRRKQTERADELHEELQGLERSNSALKKEIAALKKDLHLYTTALERHEPLCHLKASASSSSPTTCPSVSPSADRQAGPSPPGVPPRASSSTLAPAPSLSTSLTSILGIQTPDCVESKHLSSSTPPTTATLASPISSSAEHFTSSSSVTSPYSGSFSAVPAPHSLFSESLITPRPANVWPVCTSLVSNPVPSSSLTTAAQLQSRQGPIHESSSMSATASFPPLHPGALDAFLMKQDSFLTASSNVVPLYSHSAVQDGGLVAQGCSMNVPQLDPSQFSRNLINSSASLLPPALRNPPLQPPLVPTPTSAFALKPRSGQQVTVNPASLLSLLTVPSPFNVPHTTSSSYDRPLSQPQPPLPTLEEPSRDLSLSEFLEVNDWILSGTSYE